MCPGFACFRSCSFVLDAPLRCLATAPLLEVTGGLLSPGRGCVCLAAPAGCGASLQVSGQRQAATWVAEPQLRGSAGRCPQARRFPQRRFPGPLLVGALLLAPGEPWGRGPPSSGSSRACRPPPSAAFLRNTVLQTSGGAGLLGPGPPGAPDASREDSDSFHSQRLSSHIEMRRAHDFFFKKVSWERIPEAPAEVWQSSLVIPPPHRTGWMFLGIHKS